MDTLVLTSVTPPVASLVLNRPKARNPTSIALLDAMDAGLDVVEGRDDIRILKLGGAGRAFCAGLDLDEVTRDEETIHRLLTRLGEVMRRIRRTPAVTVAEVQGAAIGGGFGFLAACDFAVTHPGAKIGYPSPTTGLSPALMAPWLVRKIGPSPARAMLLRGGTITGTRAFELGIVTDLADEEELSATTDALVDHLLAAPEHALIAMKTFLNTLDGSNDDGDLDHAARVSAEVIAHEATQERMRALR